MKRKIIKQGRDSLTITLPSQWAKKFDLKGGDELETEERGRSLIINTKKEIKSVAKINASELGIFTKNHLSELYHLGYDEIEIFFNDAQTFKQIKERIQDCVGFEIIDQSEKYCRIKSISETLSGEYETILRKTFLMLLSLAENCFEAIEKQEFDRLNELRLLESMNNKFTGLCLRILNKKGYEKDSKKTPSAYSLIKFLETIADNYKYICDHFSQFENQKKISLETRGLFKEVNSYLRMFYELYYKYDTSKGKKIFEKRKDLLRKAYALFKTKPKHELILTHHLINTLTRIYEAAGVYFELVL